MHFYATENKQHVSINNIYAVFIPDEVLFMPTIISKMQSTS
jgi:hypothetical protein